MKAKRVSVLSGVLLLALIMYGAGFLSAHRNLLPYRKLVRAGQLLTSLREVGRDMAETSYRRRAPHVADQRYVVHLAAAIAPGMLAVTRLDPETLGYVTDLIAVDGSVLHTWPINHAAIVPGGYVWESPSGSKVLPDGSVLVGFASQPGLARIDACARPVWVLAEEIHHHAMQPDQRGGYWTWRSVRWAGSQDQVMLRFDPDTGEELEAIDLVDDVIGPHPEAATAMGIPPGYRFHRGAAPGDAASIFNPTDLEPLPEQFAGAFPQFTPGDLLVSLRTINMVAVLDRATHAVLWAKRGPWREPHDVDWQADGTITVFNNNIRRQWSHITVVRPGTDEVRNLFDAAGPRYYTERGGNHQRLPNGNWLIVSSKEGRVIEVSGSGAPVREYNNIINDEYNAVLTYAEYLPPDYFERMPACPGR